MADKDKDKENEAPQVKAKNVTPEDARWIKEHEDELSDTTAKYGKWIHNLDEHEDHEGQSLVTRSHEVIKKWAQERDAKPATVPGTEHDGRPGVLRFQFPGYGGDDLEEISWDDWFATFDERELAFIFQEHMSNGDQSNFFMFDSPNREHD